MYYQNVRGINTKLPEVFNGLSSLDADIVILTETWLSDSVFDAEVVPPSYQVIRKDRDFVLCGRSRGGGVLIAIRDHVQYSEIDLQGAFSDFPQIDAVCVRIGVAHRHVVVLGIYCPPATPRAAYSDLFSRLSALDMTMDGDLIIAGDFNLAEYSPLLPSTDLPASIAPLCDFLNFMSLSQHNSTPNSYGKFLDLIISNCRCDVIGAPDVLTAEDAHHPALYIDVRIPRSVRSYSRQCDAVFFNFKKADFEGLYDALLRVNWDSLRAYNCLEDATAEFYATLYSVLDRFVPKTKKFRSTFPPWFTSDIVRKIKLKHRMLRRFRDTGDQSFVERFRVLRREIKSMVAGRFREYSLRSEEALRSNPRGFWRFVNYKKRGCDMPDVMHLDDNSFRTPPEIADAFASHFKSVFLPSSPFDLPDLGSGDTSVREFSFSHADVVKALKSVKNSSVAGPDGIPSFLLRDCALVFAGPLHILFDLSIKTCSFPAPWKESIVTPIYKRGERHDIVNYRPVVLINNFPKVLESLIYGAMYSLFSPQISPAQHGFVRGRSTGTNLFLITQMIATNIDNKSQTDVIYTDFSKAFDRVDHSVLLCKILKAGFSLPCVHFLRSYLTDRSLSVRIGGFQSELFRPTSGVPQGSNLGPLLFLIFVNDILASVSSKALLFADDLKLFATISSISDCERLQRDVDGIQLWCSVNNLTLNSDKCYAMSYSLKSTKISYNYCVGSNPLARPNLVRDLGVLFDPKLSFAPHVDELVSAASRMMGYIIRNARDLSVSTARYLFSSLVLPRLEYGSIIWSPTCTSHISRIERIQRRFLKYMSFREDGVYPVRGFPQSILCTRYSFLSCANRRSRAYIVFLYRLISGDGISCPDILRQLSFRVPRTHSSRLSDGGTFYLPTPRTDVLRSSPLYQMCFSYENISNSIDIFSCSVSSIKGVYLAH